MEKITAKYSAEEIARFFISKARNEEGGTAKILTPLKLQKILYYAQGWYLGLHKTPLFSERVYAWKYGPVVQEIYNKYRVYGSQDLALISTVADDHAIDDATQQYLEKVWKTYKDETAEDLVTRTHSSEPWLLAWKEPFSDIIEKNSMAEHFTKLLR